MTTWDGHLPGGIFFVIHGLWWIFLSIWYHLRPPQDSSKAIKKARCFQTKLQSTDFELRTGHGCSKSWLPQPLFPSIPMEPILKIVCGSIGIFSQAFLSLVITEKEGSRRLEWHMYRIFDDKGNFNRVNKFQHITMYSGFMLSGVIDLLCLFAKFPRATSPLYFTLAFVVESALFWFHFGGHGVLTATYHELHLVIIFSCIVFSYLRTHANSNMFLVNIGLSCSILLQGTWFLQSSFLVFKDGDKVWELLRAEPQSKKLEHMVPMYLGAVFTWHLMAVAMATLIIWIIMYCTVNRSCIVTRRNIQASTLPAEYIEDLMMMNKSFTDEKDQSNIAEEEHD